MTVPGILQQLARLTPALPRKALQAAVQQREEIVPELLKALERASSDANAVVADSQDMLHVYASYLLAQFREPRAYAPLVKLLSLPEELLADLLGDIVTSDGSRILASVCDGDVAPLMKLAEDENINQQVRGEAIETLAVLVVWGEKTKQETVGYYRELFRGRLPKPGLPYVWAALVIACCSLNASELLPEIRQAYEEGLVGADTISLKNVEEAFALHGEELSKRFLERHPRITDTAREFTRWASFREKEAAVESSLSKALNEPPTLRTAPYVAPPKVRRNEPCPCGSGKKFKKCCGMGK
jgi:hypothetical protein